MRALPSLIALLLAVAMAAPLLGAMRGRGRTRRNWRGRELPFPFGVPVAASALPALALAVLAPGAALPAQALPAALYCTAVFALGLVDDRYGGGAHAGSAGTEGAGTRAQPRSAPRGLRGHAAALLRGEPSTGALKAAGSMAAAVAAVSLMDLGGARRLLAVAVLVLATHLFNLLDLRPGRASKMLVLLAALLAAGSRELRPLWAVGPFLAAALVAGAFDLRERAMLGDCGASLLGAIAGLLLVLALPAAGQLAALAILGAAVLYGEVGSISALVERTPGLRELDSWGRPS
jgi:UDP-GlcNAc:undecaprenyl-phosphate/decaprenyl-phosphate GlcNAc-1-phosphate transferase